MKSKFVISGLEEIEAEILQDLRDVLKTWAKVYGIKCQFGGAPYPIDSDTIDILSYRVFDAIKARYVQEFDESVRTPR